MTDAKSILVVGGGVVGLCVAYYAMRRGHRVTILDRSKPTHDGCSTGNAGMIVPSHFVPLAAPGVVGMGLRMMLRRDSPFAVRPRVDAGLLRWGWLFHRASTPGHVTRSSTVLRDLSLTSRALYEELQAGLGTGFGLVQKGLLMLCKSAHTLDEEAKAAEIARELGLTATVLTPAEAAALDPGIRMDIAGAVHFAQDCHLSPTLLLDRLTEALNAGGAKVCWETEATGWRVEGRQVQAIQTTAGEREADEYVLAGGSWSPQIARSLGLRLPMQAGKGYSLTLKQPRQMPQLCSICTEARVAVTPMGDTLRFGGTMEIVGQDRSVSPARVQGILKAIPRYFPEFTPEDFQDLPVWSGLRPCSPDGLPYVGRFGRYDNVSAATGHAMMGVSLAPVTGKLLSEVLSDEPPSLPLTMLNPDRYG